MHAVEQAAESVDDWDRISVTTARICATVGEACSSCRRGAPPIVSIEILGGPSVGSQNVHCAVVQLCCVYAGDRSRAAQRRLWRRLARCAVSESTSFSCSSLRRSDRMPFRSAFGRRVLLGSRILKRVAQAGMCAWRGVRVKARDCVTAW